MSEELSRRLGRIEEDDAIRRLVHRYARLCDANYDPKGLGPLFTDDAVWAAASPDGSVDFGRHEGREAIERFFAEVSATTGPMTLHFVTNGEVDLAPDRLTATGSWYSLTYMERLLDDGSRETVALGSTYSHEYRKVDGEWLFSRLECTFSFDLPMPTSGA